MNDNIDYLETNKSTGFSFNFLVLLLLLSFVWKEKSIAPKIWLIVTLTFHFVPIFHIFYFQCGEAQTKQSLDTL